MGGMGWGGGRRIVCFGFYSFSGDVNVTRVCVLGAYGQVLSCLRGLCFRRYTVGYTCRVPICCSMLVSFNVEDFVCTILYFVMVPFFGFC
jgi:hypothetical protein